MRKLVILSGLSGSGTTSVMQELLDLNYMILSSLESDNFFEIIEKILISSKNKKIAIHLDVKNISEYEMNYQSINRIKDKFNDLKIYQIFLTCQNETLIHRYQENRKIHPYLKYTNSNISMIEAIRKEKEITKLFQRESDYVLDTSFLATIETKKLVKNFVSENTKFTINLISFGFKYRIDSNSDFLFDVRFLPNPYYKKELRKKTGKDQSVRDYVFSTDTASEFYNHIKEIIEISVPGYQKASKESLTISFACTGGQHRSVSFVEKLAEDLKGKYSVNKIHVEEDRGHWNG